MMIGRVNCDMLEILRKIGICLEKDRRIFYGEIKGQVEGAILQKIE